MALGRSKKELGGRPDITFLLGSGSTLLAAGQTKRIAMPERVQLRRVKGWRMPANTRKVDRTTIFGNPFDSVRNDAGDAVRSHGLWLTGVMTDDEIGARYPGIVANHLISRRRRVLDSLRQLRGLKSRLLVLAGPALPCRFASEAGQRRPLIFACGSRHEKRALIRGWVNALQNATSPERAISTRDGEMWRVGHR